MGEAQSASIPARLVPLAGPSLSPLELTNKEGGLVIGRHETCDLRLSPDTVSRFHARLWRASGHWHLADLKSRWGTYLNGCRLTPDRHVILKDGDLIRITPWTFSFTTGPKRPTGVDSLDDRERAHTLVRALAPRTGHALADDLLALLLESAAGMHTAEDEQSLAQMVLDAATRGTGLNNAAILRPLDASGRIEVVATRGGAGDDPDGFYSRSLLATASNGVLAELSQAPSMSESIYRLNITAAICVPLMLGATVAGYLYLDSRGTRTGEPQRLAPSAMAFCTAIGKMASLALANLKRLDVERRQAALEAEVMAGAKAQRWIMPPRQGKVGAFTYIGESRPGRYMGGDFFDVIPLADGRVAVALGDVSGKGIEASVLMTASQGFLHAAIQSHGQPERAVAELNRYVCGRRPEGKFITLWVGVFDVRERALRYVDAGHGYALLSRPGATACKLEGQGLPVGIEQEAEYQAQTEALCAGCRAVVISDGIVEQPEDQSGGSTQPHLTFGLDGVMRCLCETSPGVDEVAALFEAVARHGGNPQLADDATALVIRWENGGAMAGDPVARR